MRSRFTRGAYGVLRITDDCTSRYNRTLRTLNIPIPKRDPAPMNESAPFKRTRTSCSPHTYLPSSSFLVPRSDNVKSPSMLKIDSNPSPSKKQSVTSACRTGRYPSQSAGSDLATIDHSNSNPAPFSWWRHGGFECTYWLGTTRKMLCECVGRFLCVLCVY